MNDPAVPGISPNRLVISLRLRQAMLAHALACLPEEACGVAGGRWMGGAAVVEEILPVENALRSPVRFRMDPQEQFNAFMTLESGGRELVAIFHSHPTGPAHPSATDLAEFAYPGVLALILSPAPGPAGTEGAWQVRAFRIDGILSPQAAVVELPVDGSLDAPPT